MKKVLPLIICALTMNFAHAQQDKQFTHYVFDRMSFNPATIGFKGYCGTLVYRNQWDRVQDAPNSTLLNLQGNIPKQNLGVGLSYIYDGIGFQRNNIINLGASYHKPTAYGTISGGLSLGIINVGFKPKWIPPQTLSDANLPAEVSGTGFDMNLGFFFHGNGGYYVGLSATHLLPPTLKKVSFKTARHYYVVAGYDYPISQKMNWGRRVDLKPSVLIKADGATAIFDVNILADIWLNAYSYVWAGFSYRLADAIPIMIGYGFSPANNPAVNFLKFGYSFDIMTNALNTYGKGTHELMVNYCMFPPPPVIPRHGNPFILQ